MAVKRLAVLGSTGSIGKNTLDVVRRHPDRFKVVSLTAASSVELLAEQALEHHPLIIAVKNEQYAGELASLLPGNLAQRVVFGQDGYVAAATQAGADMVLSAMVGAAGLLPTMRAVQAGLDLALANKETLVAAGSLVMKAARKSGAAVLPVDSEHSAIFQCLMGNDPTRVNNIWLTASGGPFRTFSRGEMRNITPDLALKHPNWEMGPKITIDSATLMNKGLEVIEARWLFGQPAGSIKVVVHPQSMIHSMVEYVDGSFMAQMAPPDMRLPIAFALAYPERISLGLPTMDPFTLSSLSFEEPDLERFPCLRLAFEALQEGDGACAVLNAANEVAVEAFLAGRIEYLDIPKVVEDALQKRPGGEPGSVEDALACDDWARVTASAFIGRKKGSNP